MRLIFIFFLIILTAPARAHEFWIDPQTYVFQQRTPITAGLFTGQNFAGIETPYFPNSFRRFEVVLGDRVEQVAGRLGDRPALVLAALGDGLHVALHETAGDTLIYQDFALFTQFVTGKDLSGALARHAARGLPQSGFTEFYTRHAKALLAVGSGAGQDRSFGLETEIVALKNPYTDDVAEGLPVVVLMNGVPRIDVQVELFDKDADGQVVVTLHRTDAQGVAVLPVARGHSYLVDSVVLREPASGSVAAKKNAVWETLWAALTFAVPYKTLP
jgi:hypothetical protein